MLERIYVEIGNVCNLNCSFCHKTIRENRIMSVLEFERVVSKIKDKTKYVYLHVLGEPLLHKDFPEILNVAKQNGLKLCITTNGTLLNKRKEPILNCGAVHKVSVSLHAPEGNGQTYFKNYLDGVVDFANAAAEKGIYVVLRLWNQDSFEGKGENRQNSFIENYLRAHFSDQWLPHGKGLRLARNIFLEYDGVFTWPAESKAQKTEQGFCYGLISQIGILADGTVVPCCLDADGDVALGNIFSQNLDEILGSKRASDFKNGLAKGKILEPFCQKCTFKNRFKIKK